MPHLSDQITENQDILWWYQLLPRCHFWLDLKVCLFKSREATEEKLFSVSFSKLHGQTSDKETETSQNRIPEYLSLEGIHKDQSPTLANSVGKLFSGTASHILSVSKMLILIFKPSFSCTEVLRLHRLRWSDLVGTGLRGTA